MHNTYCPKSTCQICETDHLAPVKNKSIHKGNRMSQTTEEMKIDFSVVLVTDKCRARVVVQTDSAKPKGLRAETACID